MFRILKGQQQQRRCTPGRTQTKVLCMQRLGRGSRIEVRRGHYGGERSPGTFIEAGHTPSPLGFAGHGAESWEQRVNTVHDTAACTVAFICRKPWRERDGISAFSMLPRSRPFSRSSQQLGIQVDHGWVRGTIHTASEHDDVGKRGI